MKTDMDFHVALTALIDEYAKEKLTLYWHTPEKRHEVLGLMASSAFKWDGMKMLEMAGEALEDCNFHDAAETVRGMVE